MLFFLTSRLKERSISMLIKKFIDNYKLKEVEDINVGAFDTKVYVDPRRICMLAFANRINGLSPYAMDLIHYSYETISDFFCSIVDSFKGRDFDYSQYVKNLHEPKENWLGMTKVGNNGKALGSCFSEALGKVLIDTTMPFLYEIRKETKKRLPYFFLMTCPGIANDRTSDIVVSLTYNLYAEYTEKILAPIRYKFHWKEVKKPYWSVEEHAWEEGNFFLPAIKDKCFILTPECLVSSNVSLNNFRTFLLNVLAKYYQLIECSGNPGVKKPLKIFRERLKSDFGDVPALLSEFMRLENEDRNRIIKDMEESYYQKLMKKLK